jgi:hypothetical protein
MGLLSSGRVSGMSGKLQITSVQHMTTKLGGASVPPLSRIAIDIAVHHAILNHDKAM